MNETVLELCRKMLEDNPDLTPAEMAHNLHCSGYAVDVAAKSVHVFYPEQTVKQMCAMLIAEYRRPLPTKEALRKGLIDAGFDAAGTDAALAELYPKDTARYAIQLKGEGFAAAPASGYYGFGTGDFTLEAWVKPETAGTLLARKGTEGCSGNGGYLVVLKPDGQLKFATDDGYGFYEINSSQVAAFDGKWHHVLAVRTGEAMDLYWDFAKLSATPRTDRFPRLNVSNSLRMLVGHTDQAPEPYNDYHGLIGEVRMWNIAKTYQSRDKWDDADWVNPGLVALWDFRGKSWDDRSAPENKLAPVGKLDFVAWD